MFNKLGITGVFFELIVCIAPLTENATNIKYFHLSFVRPKKMNNMFLSHWFSENVVVGQLFIFIF